ncbi:MAG: flagellar biosynthesis anti-sigma factor FlgM [Candidatus Methylomirabilia bacterium]
MEIREISRVLQQQTDPTLGGVRPAEAQRDQGDRTAQGSTDAVQVSEKGRILAELHQAAKGVPEVRQDRVQAVRQAVQSGELEPDPRKTAESLLQQGVLDDLLGP